MVINEVSGSWDNATEVSLPADAAMSPNANLESISCPSAGNCGAVGGYDGGAYGTREGLLVNEVSGVWKPSTEATPLATKNGGGVDVSSISCAAVASCIAVGDSNDSGDSYVPNDQQGIIESFASASTGSTTSSTPGSSPPSLTPRIFPHIAINSKSIIFAGKSLKGSVRLTCQIANCAGSLKLTETVAIRVTVRVKSGKKIVERKITQKKVEILARTSYKLASGKSAQFRLVLTLLGRHVLAGIGRRSVREKLVVTAGGGIRAAKTVVVT